MNDKAGMSVREYARHRKEQGLIGTSPWSVTKALKEGRIARNDLGKIDPQVADRHWEENSSPTMRHKPNVPIPSPIRSASSVPVGAKHSIPIPPLAHSRAIREAYQAKLARLDYEERVGTLVAKEKVRNAAMRKGQIVRDRLLAVPDRVASEIAAMTDPREITELLENEFRHALQELADG